MKNIEIRPLKQSDMPKIKELLKTVDGFDEDAAEKRTLLMERLAFTNPCAEMEPTYWVAEDNDKIVAHLGRMPTQFVINKQIKKGYFFQDLYVHPEYREKGMGFFLSMSLSETLEKNCKSFICTFWTSPFTLAMQERRGYYRLDADVYIKILNPYYKLINRISNKSICHLICSTSEFTLKFLDNIICKYISNKYEVSQLERFDNRFDSLIERVTPKTGISPIRNSNYYNWKFIDRPYSTATVFNIIQNGKISGVIIVDVNREKEYPTGVIVDIIADSNDTKIISALISTAIKYLRKRSVYTIECCFSNKKIAKKLKKFLFINREGHSEPFMLTNLEYSTETDYLCNIDNWDLTYAASDVLMLVP